MGLLATDLALVVGNQLQLVLEKSVVVGLGLNFGLILGLGIQPSLICGICQCLVCDDALDRLLLKSL